MLPLEFLFLELLLPKQHTQIPEAIKNKGTTWALLAFYTREILVNQEENGGAF